MFLGNGDLGNCPPTNGVVVGYESPTLEASSLFSCESCLLYSGALRLLEYQSCWELARWLQWQALVAGAGYGHILKFNYRELIAPRRAKSFEATLATFRDGG